jgi:hypothetical protein
MEHTPRHAARPGIDRLRLAGALAGCAAVLVAVAVGVIELNRAPQAPAVATYTTAREITTRSDPIPLSADQLHALLVSPLDYGALTDPLRRAACLRGLGYPADTPLLGARPVQIAGRDAVVLIVLGEQAHTFDVFAVPTTCNAADTGLLARTVLPQA